VSVNLGNRDATLAPISRDLEREITRDLVNESRFDSKGADDLT
jgi:hypothetical protein